MRTESLVSIIKEFLLKKKKRECLCLCTDATGTCRCWVGGEGGGVQIPLKCSSVSKSSSHSDGGEAVLKLPVRAEVSYRQQQYRVRGCRREE